MKRVLIFLAMVPNMLSAQSSVKLNTFLEQRAVYFTSDRVTIAGFGAGVGTQATWDNSLVAQADAGLLWGNGNSIPMRVMIGFQRDGRWSPAVLGTFCLFWGQRTERLSETGQRPIIPVWAAGILIAPLRYGATEGTVSALEIGCGIGPYKGLNLELTILSAGMVW